MAKNPRVQQPNKKSRSQKRGSRRRTGLIATPATKSASPVVVKANDQLVPDVLSTELLYADQFQLTSGAAQYIQQQWKLNSAYDPDYTNVGAQPVGYDQIASFYGFYKVFKTEIEVTVTPSTKPLSISLYPSPNVTIATTYGAQASQAHGQTQNCSIYQQIHFKMSFPIARHLGVDSEEFADVVYGADIGSNPTRLLYGTLVAMNQDNSVGCTCYLSFKMRLFVQFQQRSYLGLSLLSPCKPSATFLLNKMEELRKRSVELQSHSLGEKESPPQTKPLALGDTPSSSSNSSVPKPKRSIKQILAEFDLLDEV